MIEYPSHDGTSFPPVKTGAWLSLISKEASVFPGRGPFYTPRAPDLGSYIPDRRINQYKIVKRELYYG